MTAVAFTNRGLFFVRKAVQESASVGVGSAAQPCRWGSGLIPSIHSRLDFCSHTCQPFSQMATPRSRYRQEARLSKPSSPSWYVATISNPLSASSLPSPQIHFPCNRSSCKKQNQCLPSRFRRKFQLLPSAFKVLEIQPPSHLPCCHSSSLVIFHYFLFSWFLGSTGLDPL